MSFDSYLEPPFDPREPFFEKVIDLIPEKELSTIDYEANENWFIDLIDKLYEICPIADPQVVSKFVVECWKHKLLIDQEDDFYDYGVDPSGLNLFQQESNLEYPDFHSHYEL